MALLTLSLHDKSRNTRRNKSRGHFQEFPENVKTINNYNSNLLKNEGISTFSSTMGNILSAVEYSTRPASFHRPTNLWIFFLDFISTELNVSVVLITLQQSDGNSIFLINKRLTIIGVYLDSFDVFDGNILRRKPPRSVFHANHHQLTALVSSI